MLNFNEISNRINSPSLINVEDLDDLRQLSEKYPFSAIFSQLYLKGLTLHDSISFDTELKLHAYKIPDRAQLFHLVHHADGPQISNKELIARETEQEAEAEQEKQEVGAEEPVNTEGDKVDSIEDDTTQEEETESKTSRSTSDLDRDIIAHAVSSSIFLEVDEEIEEEYSFAQLKRLDKSNTTTDEPTEVEFDLSHDDDQDTIEENKTKTRESEEEEFKTFTSWVSGYIEKNQATNQPKIEKKSNTEENFEEIFDLAKKEKEFFSPTKKAKESLDESRLPVSETLAKIYIAQGNYPKAIHSYEKLMLKFPEKKSFFAIQIQTLKKKLN